MSARDELALLLAVTRYPHIGEAWDERDERSPAKYFSFKEADAILAAGYSKPRTITTLEEVEALTDGSVLIDSHGDVANLRDDFWFSYETAPMTHHRMAKYLPATVLYEGVSK